MKGKRVFVSGGAGVIGSCLVEQLLAQGALVFVGDLKVCPAQWRGRLRYRQGDLNKMQEAELLAFDPELVFHLAATFERTEETPEFFSENFRNNVQLSHHLLRLLHHSTSLQKILFASSYLLYDPKQYLDQPHLVTLSEESPIWPRNLCGAAKLLHEQELAFFSAMRGIPTVSARIFRVYGKGSRDIVSRWVRSALQNAPIIVYGEEGIFDYIYAEEVAEGLWRLAESTYQGVVQLGTQQPRSVREVLHAILSLLPHTNVVFEKKNLPLERSCADISLLKSVLGWVPSRLLETVLPDIVAFEKSALAAPPLYPKRRGVLLSSISQKKSLIQAVRHASQKIGAFLEIHGCDASPGARGRYIVDHFWLVPPLEKWTIDQILCYAKEHQVGAIIPTRDGELLFFAEHKNVFQRHGIAVFVSDLDVVRLCLDKWAFAQFLEEKRLPGIPTALHMEDLPPAQDYVVKPRWGAGGKGMRVKCSSGEAIDFAQKIQNPLYQPWVEGQEWSVDVYRSPIHGVVGAIARERNQVVEGESKITTTKSFPELETLGSNLADQLGICGHCVIQVIVDPSQQLHIIECNPRFGGASAASVAAGLDSFFWFFTQIMDEGKEPAFFAPSRCALCSIRLEEDLLIAAESTNFDSHENSRSSSIRKNYKEIS